MADVCAVLVPRYLESATDNAETRGFEGNSRCVDERIGINVQSCLTAERTGRAQTQDATLAEEIQGWSTRERQRAIDLKVNKDVRSGAGGAAGGPTWGID